MGSGGAGAGPGKGNYPHIVIKAIPPHLSPRHSCLCVLIQMLRYVDSKKRCVSWAGETCSNYHQRLKLGKARPGRHLRMKNVLAALLGAPWG